MNLIKETYKPQGRPPDASVIRYALHLRYASLQAYRVFFERFPMPYFSLLNKIQQGGADMLNVLKTLHEKGSFSCDCSLMIDEIYLRKSAQYQSGEYVGVDEEGITMFMVVGLKQSIISLSKPFRKSYLTDIVWSKKLVITLATS